MPPNDPDRKSSRRYDGPQHNVSEVKWHWKKLCT